MFSLSSVKLDEKTNKLCYNIYMTPNEDLVHYIEDELYKGVPIADVLYAVRTSGWNERQIQDAMAFLDRQHEAMLIDSLPPPQTSRLPSLNLRSLSLPNLSFNWRLSAGVMGVTVVAIILMAGLIKIVSRDSKQPFQQLSDPNFSINVPQSWHVDQNYKPGSRMLFIRSAEDSSPDAALKTALLTVYPDAELDVFGKQLQSESLDVEIIRDETTKDGSIRTRFIEFRTRDVLGDGMITHGEYVLVDKSLVKMSAMITAREEFWPAYAVAAEQTLRSFMPGCSRASGTITPNSDGIFNICGRTAIPDSSTSDGSAIKLPD